MTSEVPISALVVDDEELARNLISVLIRRDPDMLLVGECSNGPDALESVAAKRPDLIFLDIHMPVMSGIAVAEKLRTADHVPYVIFVTAFDEHAIKAFELNALDYLVKPLQKERFRMTVDRAKTAIRNQETLALTRRLLKLGRTAGAGSRDRGGGQELTVRNGDSIVQLTTNDIVWIEAANQYVRIHTKSRVFTVCESLSRYSKRISDPEFFRIHRSALVNGRAVERVMKQRNGTHLLRTRDGKTLVLARSRSSMIPDILRAARLASSNV